MSRFALGSSFRIRDRRFYGLRGWEGKPIHPPFTDVPIGAYIVGAILDVVSYFADSRDLHLAAGYAFLVGGGFSLLAALTGLADWLAMRAGSEVRRITNSHALTMIVVTVLVAGDLVWRFAEDADSTGVPLLILSLATAGLLTFGAAIGGSLVFDKGYRVRVRTAEPGRPPAGGSA